MTPERLLIDALEATGDLPPDTPVAGAYGNAGAVYLNWNDVEGVAACMLLASPDLAAALDLGTAWAEAVAALPEGWWLHAINAWSFGDMAYRVEACAAGEQDDLSEAVRFASGPTMSAYAPTPAAALRALAAKLRERAG